MIVPKFNYSFRDNPETLFSKIPKDITVLILSFLTEYEYLRRVCKSFYNSFPSQHVACVLHKLEPSIMFREAEDINFIRINAHYIALANSSKLAIFSYPLGTLVMRAANPDNTHYEEMLLSDTTAVGLQRYAPNVVTVPITSNGVAVQQMDYPNHNLVKYSKPNQNGLIARISGTLHEVGSPNVIHLFNDKGFISETKIDLNGCTCSDIVLLENSLILGLLARENGKYFSIYSHYRLDGTLLNALKFDNVVEHFFIHKDMLVTMRLDNATVYSLNNLEKLYSFKLPQSAYTISLNNGILAWNDSVIMTMRSDATSIWEIERDKAVIVAKVKEMPDSKTEVLDMNHDMIAYGTDKQGAVFFYKFEIWDLRTKKCVAKKTMEHPIVSLKIEYNCVVVSLRNPTNDVLIWKKVPLQKTPNNPK